MPNRLLFTTDFDRNTEFTQQSTKARNKIWPKPNLVFNMIYTCSNTINTCIFPLYLLLPGPILAFVLAFGHTGTKQIEAGRIVFGATKSCSRGKNLFEFGWDTLEQRCYKHHMIDFFKMVKNLTPPYVQDLVPPSVHQVSNRNLCNQFDFTIPRSRTNLYVSSFIPTATRKWNSLPEVINSSTWIAIFIKSIKSSRLHWKWLKIILNWCLLVLMSLWSVLNI